MAMFRKQDFKKVDLLGSGKKNTKIYKAEHIPTGKYYALKEVEAKTLDKLNEYKEEAVQLFKVQNHPNVLQFYGYYFYETMYNTFRIAMVCEYMDSRTNLEYLFRKRKQQGLYWSQEELEKMIVSVISTMSYLQSVGMAHRDLKPANKFLIESGEIKIIDFGESKDYFKDQDDGGCGTMATIRGTPQYLSPILWKAHVEDGGNTRHVVHNLFKSDVYSCGLIFFQLASMEDVTGFNQKNQVNDGEKLVEQGLKKLRQRYSDHIIEIIRLMLKFEENDRPSFVELAKLVLTSTENTIESPKNGLKSKDSKPGGNKSVSKVFSAQSLKDKDGNPIKQKAQHNADADGAAASHPAGNEAKHTQVNQRGNSAKGGPGSAHLMNQNLNMSSAQPGEDGMVSRDAASAQAEKMAAQQQHLMTQSELFKSYAEQNNLYLNLTNNMLWFEFGGNKIGRLFIEGPDAEEFPKWRLIAKFKGEFPCHFTLVYVNGGAVGSPNIATHKDVGTWFLLGGMGNNCLQYFKNNILSKAAMLQEKSFFCAVSAHGGKTIYTFGGYENTEKVQLRCCEYYSIEEDKWYINDNVKLNVARSQSSCCLFEETVIFIFGGYNKEMGTLNSIERFDINSRKMSLLDIKMTIPLRRFATCKISQSKILLLGGISRLSKDSDAVFCFDIEKVKGNSQQSQKEGKSGGSSQFVYSLENLDKVDKAGVIDYPVIIDSVGSLHMFVENACGTSPPYRTVYSFLEYS